MANGTPKALQREISNIGKPLTDNGKPISFQRANQR